jgi:SAM-dependent methyltransferase
VVRWSRHRQRGSSCPRKSLSPSWVVLIPLPLRRELSMTEWNAPEYARVSELQKAMADEALSLLDLSGTERILDVGCGNGRITAEIAARVPGGSALGVDSSADMIAFASAHFGPALRPPRLRQ